MIRPTATTLKFAPTGEYIAARIVSLTRKMIDEQVMGSWWTHQDLMRKFEVPPIDRHWDWRNVTVEFEGRSLSSRKVAIVAGDGHVEGVMVLATDPISSAIDAGGRALLVEWLVTAPRNRRELRIDGKDFVKGSGFQLLAWAARLSRHNGYSGRLRLEASPGSVGRYIKWGLQLLNLKPTVYEGITYTPMELPPDAARRLISP